MLTSERHSLILQLLQERKAVSVTELTKELGISESTIRRDLISLDELGKLKKVHGGATAIEDVYLTFEADVATKSTLNVEEKMKVGKYAASLINDDDFIFIDAGTTTEKLIDFIVNTKAIFVTNGIVHAKKLIQKGYRTYLIGGELKLSTEALVGAEGISNLKKYNFTKSFIGTNGISVEQGFTTPEIEEGLLKKEVVSRSYMAYVLADHTKFGKVTSVTFANLEQACILTDYAPEERYKKATIVKEVIRSDLHSDL
jgi:DeoR family fructose operon transcriptional repressor